MDDTVNMEEVNFGAELGKAVVATMVICVATVVGLYVGTVAIEKIDAIRTNRRNKKAQASE